MPAWRALTDSPDDVVAILEKFGVQVVDDDKTSVEFWTGSDVVPHELMSELCDFCEIEKVKEEG